MAYYLGIDGGGTKTTCLLGDENSVLASETVGGSNIIRLGEDKARDVIHQGIRGVCAAAGIGPEEVVAACAGVGGAAQPSTCEQMTAILAELVPGTIEVVGDMVVAHEAALGGGAGIIVIAGTGSIAHGRNESGVTARSGGWGYMISDEGSGHWIGVQAVAAIARFGGHGHATELAKRVLERWELASVDELVRRANSPPPPDFAGLFPDVLELENRDPSIPAILGRAGTELAKIAESVYRALWTPSVEVQVALAGGVFQNSATVRDSFRAHIKELGLNASIQLSNCDPAIGALSLARRLGCHSAGRTTSE